MANHPRRASIRIPCFDLVYSLSFFVPGLSPPSRSFRGSRFACIEGQGQRRKGVARLEGKGAEKIGGQQSGIFFFERPRHEVERIIFNHDSDFRHLCEAIFALFVVILLSATAGGGGMRRDDQLNFALWVRCPLWGSMPL